MNEQENKNRDARIKQQKQLFWKRAIICLVLILAITIIFVAMKNKATGTKINVNTFEEELSAGHIKEVYFENDKVQVYYVNGDAHWLYYARGTSEQDILMQMILAMGDNKPVYQYGTTTTISILNILYPVLMIGISIAFFVFLFKRVKGENNKSFEFVKSRARVTPSKTKFSDVAGEDEEKAELEDVVDFLKNPQKYIDLGAKIPKGVLLVGPPGTGKTLLARAVAGEANVPFFTISGSDFMELFVGVGASRVRDLFENAKKAKPSIIFIDEIDAVGRQRGAGLGGGNDEREQTLNQLLVQMDGFEANEGVIVMAATNRVDILDPALLRPGRFDRTVHINIPDIKGREEILKVHARNKPLDKNIDLKNIARITSGFTGAEIENLLNESAILTAKENRKVITEEDIQKSMMKVTLGPQKKSRVISDQEKFNTAVHESGHAIIHKLAKEPSPVQEVSIIPRGGAGGYTLSADDDKLYYYKETLYSKIQALLGGICAEKLILGDTSTGASSDLKRATSLAKRMVTEWGMSDELGFVYSGSDGDIFVGKNYQERMSYSESQASRIDAEIKKIIDKCEKDTTKLLKDNKNKLLAMSNVLVEKETIYAEEIDLIMSGKSKEEIIEYIYSKDKTKTEDEKPKTEEVNIEEVPEAKIEEKDIETISGEETKEVKTVDDILKLAEEREAEKNIENKAKKVENIEEKLTEEGESLTEIEEKPQVKTRQKNANNVKKTVKNTTKTAKNTKNSSDTKKTTTRKSTKKRSERR